MNAAHNVPDGNVPDGDVPDGEIPDGDRPTSPAAETNPLVSENLREVTRPQAQDEHGAVIPASDLQDAGGDSEPDAAGPAADESGDSRAEMVSWLRSLPAGALADAAARTLAELRGDSRRVARFPEESERKSEAGDQSGEFAAEPAAPEAPVTPEAAADIALGSLRDTAMSVANSMRAAADRRRAEIAAGTAGPDAPAVIETLEEYQPQIAALAEAARILAEAATGAASARLIVYIFVLRTAIGEEAERQKEEHPFIAKLLAPLEKKFPWLIPALTAKSHVREWTAGGEIGLPFAKGQLSITFDDRQSHIPGSLFGAITVAAPAPLAQKSETGTDKTNAAQGEKPPK
jgi:hypothetical protein